MKKKNSNVKNELIFRKQMIISFVNVETDPRVW
jgi:hypothetical protein